MHTNDMQVLCVETTGNSKMNIYWQYSPVSNILMLYSQIVNIFMKESFHNRGYLSAKKRQMSSV